MKHYILSRLAILIVFLSVLLMLVSAFLQFQSATETFITTADMQIDRMINIVNDNNHSNDQLQEDLKTDYLIRAKAAAYMINNNPQVIHDLDQLNTIIQLLQVDEIHLFNPEGTIFAGTVPEYYGFSVHSGEQIGFFAPMLDDYDLEMAQDVTPNTAAAKEMQYVAVWDDTNSMIVQLGIEPIRLLVALAETELTYLFSRQAPAIGNIILAIDPLTNTIISSTDSDLNNKSISELGLYNNITNNITNNIDLVTVNIAGQEGQAMFKQSNDLVIGLICDNQTIYQSAVQNTLIIVISGIVLGAIIIVLLYFMLDKVVLRGLYKINYSLNRIAGGDLEHQMQVSGLPEFVTMSKNVNLMVQSILEVNGKFSTIFSHVNIPLAMYECHAERVVVTSKMSEILDLDIEQEGKLLNPTQFLAKIEQIMTKPYQNEQDVYIFEGKNQLKYLKIKLYRQDMNSWGIIIDVTADINEKQNIIFERDIDFLTNIYNRRAFLEELDRLFKDINQIKNAAMIMLDLDNLKYVNDTWGHATGDAFISRAAQVLSDFDFPNKLTARLSGDEFVIMLYGADDTNALEQAILQLAADYQKAYISTPDQQNHPVTISAGYAFYPQQSLNIKEILSFADQAMYTVKRTGKGQFGKYIP